jgi:hypothetical protein
VGTKQAAGAATCTRSTTHPRQKAGEGVVAAVAAAPVGGRRLWCLHQLRQENSTSLRCIRTRGQHRLGTWCTRQFMIANHLLVAHHVMLHGFTFVTNACAVQIMAIRMRFLMVSNCNTNSHRLIILQPARYATTCGDFGGSTMSGHPCANKTTSGRCHLHTTESAYDRQVCHFIHARARV